MTHYYPTDSLKSPRFAGIATFVRLSLESDPSKADVAIIGVPFGSRVSYRPGARFGPRDIRAQSALIRPYNPELKVNIFRVHSMVDFVDADEVRYISELDAFMSIVDIRGNVLARWNAPPQALDGTGGHAVWGDSGCDMYVNRNLDGQRLVKYQRCG